MHYVEASAGLLSSPGLFSTSHEDLLLVLLMLVLVEPKSIGLPPWLLLAMEVAVAEKGEGVGCERARTASPAPSSTAMGI